MSPVYLITGATGIAAATAELAAREGAQIFLVSRTAAHLAETAERIRSAGGVCGFAAADLTDSAAVEAAVASCCERFGRIDALYNVAGISGRRFGDGPLHECTEEGWDRTLETNVKSIFLMCRAVLGRMLKQETGEASRLRGTILNMASVLAASPEPRHFATHAYAASKGAIISLSRSMAAYYAPQKIRVNAIAPALVRTPMSQRAQSDEEVLRLMRTKQPLTGDLIEAEEVARASLFLLSDASRNITGDVLTIDAGWSVSS